MRRLLMSLLLAWSAPLWAADYVPPPGEGWAWRSAADAGFDAGRLQAAIDLAVASESAASRDLSVTIAESFGREPVRGILGPVRPRGEPTGVILRRGYLVAEWGEPWRPDMTFSVTKSLLSAVVGIAHERGLIPDLHAPVAAQVQGGWFDDPHNAPITWDMLLRQTSNWRGTLWDRPHWADRPVGDDPAAWPTAPLPPPGEGWKYNDVRVNLLALAATLAWGEALPVVAEREILGPIGASDGWEWHGYGNSWVDVGGRRLQSVSGGGHWGGGLFISARDLARFGLLFLRGGRWGERTIWSADWQDYAATPTPQNPGYGVMNWFLNGDRQLLPAAPASAVAHLGFGSNLVYVDRDNDLVVVARWIERARMGEFIAAVLAALESQPAAQATATVDHDARLAAFFEEVFQRELQSSPVFQSQLGLKGPDYGRWDDFSDAEARRRNELRRQDLERLRRDFDYARLTRPAQISYRIFEYLQDRALRNFRWRHHAYAFSTQSNPASFPVTFLRNVHRVDDVADAEAYISRLRGHETLTAQFLDGMRRSTEIGVVPTSFSFDPVLEDSRALLAGAPFDDSGTDSALWADFQAKVGKLEASDEEKERLLAEARDALTGPYRRSVEAWIAAVEALRPRSPGPHGVWKLPDGEAYYRSRIDHHTTQPDLSADEIHAIGLAEVARIRGQMEVIRRRVGFDGDLDAFFEHLRSHPSNFFPDTPEGRQAYLDQSKAYIDAIYSDVGDWFRLLPKAPLEVRAVEPWREKTAPVAFYNQPSLDGSRPGIYYVNMKDMGAVQKHQIETIAYHEGAPGHHFQIAIQQELTGVPQFQRFAHFGAYIEGWGLYAELLAREMGRFADPLQDFGRLQDEMLRAVRLVVDTGAHARRWTREQVIDYMLANNPMTREEAGKEAERYLDDPGQALGYKIGMLKILELRERARSALGERFDIRDFHDVVLRNGALPLAILEELVDAWIASVPAG